MQFFSFFVKGVVDLNFYLRAICPIMNLIVNIMEKKKGREVPQSDIMMEGKIWTDNYGICHRYVDPMTDKGFKILFGSEGNEDLLMGLLNSIIPDADIIDVRYCNPEHPGMTEDDSGAIFDVYCETSEGVRFLVEMQNWSQRYFNKRAVYYSTFAIQDQAKREKRHQMKTLGNERWDYNYAPVYVVCFLTFNMKNVPTGMEKIKEEDYLSFYRYIDVESGEELGDGTTLVFVEMKKFRKGLNECGSKREQIMCILKNMRNQLEMPPYVSDPLLIELYERSEIASMPEYLKINYINFIMSRNDELNSRAEMLEAALAEGEAQGYAKGVEVGHAKGIAEGIEDGHKAGLKEGRKAGIEEGLKEGRKTGIEEGLKEGRKAGIEEGLKEGRKAGIEEGLKEGRKEAMLETARKLKALGVEAKTIAQATGLDAEAVGNLT